MKKSEELRSLAVELTTEIDELSTLEEPTEEQTQRLEQAIDEVGGEALAAV